MLAHYSPIPKESAVSSYRKRARSLKLARRPPGCPEDRIAIVALVEREDSSFRVIRDLRAPLPSRARSYGWDFDRRFAELPDADAVRVREDIACYLHEHPHVNEIWRPGWPP